MAEDSARRLDPFFQPEKIALSQLPIAELTRAIRSNLELGRSDFLPESINTFSVVRGYGAATLTNVGNQSITATGFSSLGSRLRVSVTCSGLRPVIAFANYKAKGPSGGAIMTDISVNGTATTVANGIPSSYLIGTTDEGCHISSYFSPITQVRRGTNTFELLSRVTTGTGTIYADANNQVTLFVQEL